MNKFFLDQQASIALETLGIFSVFILIITLSADIGQALATKIKLNNLSYSLASLVRERNALYSSSSEPLTQEEVDHLYEVATLLLKSSSIEKIAITIDSLSFKSSSLENQGEGNGLSFTQGDLKCQSQQDINTLAEVSFYTKLKTWNTIYQVTLCASTKNNFLKVGQTLFHPIGNAIVYGK